MEFPELGEQCSRDDCKQLDFIPLRCECGQFFCRHHFLPHCISGECPKPVKSKLNENSSENSVIHKCNFPSCKTANLIEMPCLKCQKHFCIGHRFHEQCYNLSTENEETLEQLRKEEEEKRNFENTKRLIQAEVTERLRKAEQTSKAKTALKVQLMKLKSKAIGEKNIPTVDRVYLAIRTPRNNTGKNIQNNSDGINVITGVGDDSIKAIFVSKHWSIGRAIDSICNLLSIKNENNVTSAPKLRLFRESDGMCASLIEMDQTLEKLLENKTLVDGERMFLEYVLNDCISSAEKGVAYFISFS